MNTRMYGYATLILLSATSMARAQVEQEREGRPPRAMMRMLPLMMALDANGDGELSAQEIEQSVAALKSLDKNSDGKVGEDELRPAFPGRGEGGPRGFGPPEGGPAGFFGGAEGVTRLMSFDKNDDGKLSGDELPERMQGILRRADSDQDGTVTKEELEALAANTNRDRGSSGRRGPEGAERGERAGFGARPGAEAMVERAMQFDENKDGQLSPQELGKAFGPLGGPLGGRGAGREGRPRRPE